MIAGGGSSAGVALGKAQSMNTNYLDSNALIFNTYIRSGMCPRAPSERNTCKTLEPTRLGPYDHSSSGKPSKMHAYSMYAYSPPFSHLPWILIPCCTNFRGPHNEVRKSSHSCILEITLSFPYSPAFAQLQLPTCSWLHNRVHWQKEAHH